MMPTFRYKLPNLTDQSLFSLLFDLLYIPYQTFPVAFLSVFLLLTGENWNGMMTDCMVQEVGGDGKMTDCMLKGRDITGLSKGLIS